MYPGFVLRLSVGAGDSADDQGQVNESEPECETIPHDAAYSTPVRSATHRRGDPRNAAAPTPSVFPAFKRAPDWPVSAGTMRGCSYTPVQLRRSSWQTPAGRRER